MLFFLTGAHKLALACPDRLLEPSTALDLWALTGCILLFPGTRREWVAVVLLLPLRSLHAGFAELRLLQTNRGK